MDAIYLDTCCLKRAFDDQRASRVRSEAAAVADVIERAELGEIRLVRSPAHQIENDANCRAGHERLGRSRRVRLSGDRRAQHDRSANPREDRRVAAALWINGFAVDVPLTDEVGRRAEALGSFGFTPLDALHLAFAEAAHARWFVTCDDRIISLARRHQAELATTVVSPLDITGSRA